jgi:hypothetical protein
MDRPAVEYVEDTEPRFFPSIEAELQQLAVDLT